MKKVILLCLAVLFFACNISNAKMQDVQGTGTYKTYRKLLNHDYSGLYDIYYKKNTDGNLDIIVKSLFESNSEEPLTFKYGNRSITLTKQQWNYLFNDFEQIKENEELLDKVTGEFFTYWIKYHLNTCPKDMVQKYFDEQKEEAKKVAERKKKIIEEKKRYTGEWKTYTIPEDIAREEAERAKKYPVMTQLSKELNNAKFEREMAKAEYAAMSQDFMKHYQTIKPQITFSENGNINENMQKDNNIGWITLENLKDIKIGTGLNLEKKEKWDYNTSSLLPGGVKIEYYVGTIEIWNNDAKKVVYRTYVGETTLFSNNKEIRKNNVSIKFVPESEYPAFYLKDLIKASVVNRIFAKNMNGDYIPNPYYPKTKKENAKDIIKYLFST